MARIFAAALLLASFAASAACVDATAVPTHSRTYVGIVRVKTPAVVGNTAVSDVSALGAGWDSGPWVGWRSSSWISADPAKCQLVVIIRSPAQAANAARVLKALRGMQPCTVDYTSAR